MTASEPLNLFRAETHDETATYTISDAVAIGWLNDAVNAVMEARPELRLDDEGDLSDWGDGNRLATSCTPASTDVPLLGSKWAPVLAQYMVAQRFRYDGNDPAHLAAAEKAEARFYALIAQT